MYLPNYLALLIESNLRDENTSNLCLSGVEAQIELLYQGIREAHKGSMRRVLSERGLLAIYNWKEGRYAIPIYRVQEIVSLWAEVTQASRSQEMEWMQKVFDASKFLTAQKSPQKIILPKLMTEELAYLLGLLYADGALTDPFLAQRNKGRFVYEISVTDASREHITKVCERLLAVFGVRTSVKAVYSGRWYRVLFASTALHRLLHCVFEMPYGKKKGKLSLPDLIRLGPVWARRAFVRGFFDGDGFCSVWEDTYCQYIVSASQADRKILRDLQQVLVGDLIRSTIKKQTRDGYTWFSLSIRDKPSIRRYARFYGFDHPEKCVS